MILHIYNTPGGGYRNIGDHNDYFYIRAFTLRQSYNFIFLSQIIVRPSPPHIQITRKKSTPYPI